jgi:hypothetical protein
MRLAPLLASLAVSLLAGGCRAHDTVPARDYLALWTASTDSTQPDFLAVFDVTAEGERYGDLVTSLAVPGLQHRPHHTEHEMPADAQLFANGFGSGRTWIFDLRAPAAPRIVSAFEGFDGFDHPHSFLRLPNGNVLATYQMRHTADGMFPGGLVELTPRGELVRSSAGYREGVSRDLRVYSGAIVPSLDRIVTTTTDMHDAVPAQRDIQIWRLSDLALLHTIPLPDGPKGDEGLYTAEPRVLADGRTVLVSTFSCGVYLLDGLEGQQPSARLVRSFPWEDGRYCAIPVVVGRYYVVTVPAWSAVVSLDISDPAAPREVGRVTLGEGDIPHWLAASPDGSRLVVTGYGDLQHRALIVQLDTTSGALALDARFRDAGASEPGVRFDARAWPHGGQAKGVPHGAVFTRR